MFRSAIVRTPGSNYADGLTTVDLGTPDFSLVLTQHAAYCGALRECGLEVLCLEPDEAHPDSTFVEDTAVLTPKSAILARPGASSRLGEVQAIRGSVEKFYPTVHCIEAPGTLDGGDICEAGSHFFLGISHRTNENGARQLAKLLAAEGYTSSLVDIRGMKSILHLKSGIAYLDRNHLVIMDELAERSEFSGYTLIKVPAAESYGCNCVLVNDRVLIAKGFPGLEASLRDCGYEPLILDMSEFQKMDGGLSCLSLRIPAHA